MSAARLLADLEQAGVSLSLNGDKIKMRGKAIPDALVARLKEAKPEILAMLQAAAANDQAVPAQAPARPIGPNGGYPPPRRVPFRSGLTAIPPEGLECATCGGTAWRQYLEGQEYLCDSCFSPPPTPKVRIPLGTQFFMSPAMVPPPPAICRCCRTRRWGWSPSNRMAKGFDGWRKWSCARCMPSEVNYPDTVFFDLEALEKGWK